MSLNARQALIEALMSKSTKNRVASCRKREVCVRPDCNLTAKKGCRGNCKEHYNQFDYARRLLATEQERQAFEDREVAAGNILPSARGRCRKRPNPYLNKVG